jgi:hypothetical protein
VIGKAGGSMNSTKITTTHAVATMPIGLPQRPRCHGPFSKLSPRRTRRNTGITYATYNPTVAIDVTAAYAVALHRYGSARISAPPAASHTALVGVCVRLLMRCHTFEPGMAPSRAKA